MNMNVKQNNNYQTLFFISTGGHRFCLSTCTICSTPLHNVKYECVTNVVEDVLSSSVPTVSSICADHVNKTFKSSRHNRSYCYRL